MKIDRREFTVMPSCAATDVEVSELSVAQLVGKVYEEAPPAERGRAEAAADEHLMRPPPRKRS